LGPLRYFASDASHKLRTPLSVLQGEPELLLSEPITPPQYQEALRVMDGELKQLSRMVEGFFTLSMPDAGQIGLDHEPFHLNEVLERSCALLRPPAEAKKIASRRNLREDFASR
jgi:signal transduction histidine kinase